MAKLESPNPSASQVPRHSTERDMASTERKIGTLRWALGSSPQMPYPRILLTCAVVSTIACKASGEDPTTNLAAHRIAATSVNSTAQRN